MITVILKVVHGGVVIWATKSFISERDTLACFFAETKTKMETKTKALVCPGLFWNV